MVGDDPVFFSPLSLPVLSFSFRPQNSLSLDHDREGFHNWRCLDRKQIRGIAVGNEILAWDSGLAWKNGPFKASFEILCGPHSWNLSSKREGEIECQRIAVFRNSTYIRLRQLMQPTLAGWSLGHELRKVMGEELTSIGEIVSKHFFFGLHLHHRSPLDVFPTAIRFDLDDFFDGIDHRARLLLSWIDDCIIQYGEQHVLL